MPTPFRCFFAAGVLILILAAGISVPRIAFGQIKAIHLPEHPVRGTNANLFVEWEGIRAFEGLSVDLPAGWALDSASVLRGSYVRLPLSVMEISGGSFQVVPLEPVESASEVALSVRIDGADAHEAVEITPLERSGDAILPRTIYRVSRPVRTKEPDDRSGNRVLSFRDDDAAPVILRRDAVPRLDLLTPFRFSVWMRTTRFAEVVLSAWNGDDPAPYPVELVVDRSGRLRAFHGRPGEHRSLLSREPVADGDWHQVTLVNAPEDGWMRLQIDGVTVDSIYSASPLPIHMELPLALGGRNPGRTPYFDGMRPFSGSLDELSIAAGEAAPFRLDFQEDVAQEVLDRSGAQPRYARGEPLARLVIEDFRAEQVSGGVRLSWRAEGRGIDAFEIERSVDGRRFEAIARLSPSTDGRYEVLDEHHAGGVAYYRIRQIGSGSAATSTVKVGFGVELPAPAELLGNYPNPFKGSTTISYEVHENVDVQIGVWDLSGQLVETLVDRVHPPGVYQVRFEANELPSGTYFVRLRTSGEIRSHKIILTK